MNDYSPFDCGLEALLPEHLTALREASEGWYIEYKREVSKATAIAKSISAFANTHGGWLFYGVEEKSKEESVAGAFPGIADEELDAALQRVRQAVVGQLNPSAHYDCKILRGPCESIGLEEGRGVICIHVPWSPAAPHVHKSGQIYRRVADGSEPRPEDDRFILDQLFRRGDKVRKYYRKWIKKDPDFSKGENERSYVRLMMVPDLWGDRNVWLDIDADRLRAIMNRDNGLISTMPFDTIYTSSDGFIARQLTGGLDPFTMGLTWRLANNLRSDILLPLNLFSSSNNDVLDDELDGYEQADRFMMLLERQSHDKPRILDLNHLFNMLVALVETQRKLFEAAGWPHGFYIKARLLNVWRSVPFLDVSNVMDRFTAHGVPMMLDRKITTPEGLSPESFAHVRAMADIETEEARILLQGIAIFAPIARAFGVPDWMIPDDKDKDEPYHVKLQNAGIRTNEVQRRREQRRQQQKLISRRY